MKSISLLLLAVAFVLPATVRAQTPAAPAITGPRLADLPAEIALSQNVMIPMRDGVRLATDIYRPARAGVATEGRFPVVLVRGPYNKDSDIAAARIFVPRGYIVISQDVRGRYRSEGRWRPIADDPNDGFDTAQWIGAQSWSDQCIGTIGSSYNAATQHALAIAGAPHVKAMIPRNAMSNFGRYGIRHHGAFELRWLNWAFTLGNATGTPNALPAALRAAADPAAAPTLATLGDRVQEYARALPLRAGTTPLKFAPDYEAWLIKAMGHGVYDDFWKNSGSSVIDHLPAYKDIPVYHVTGWYDSWGTSVANLNFVELAKAKKSLQRLIVGPWIHSAEHLDYAGEAQFTPDAALDRASFQLRWFDRWLKGIDNGVDREPPVRIYVMGGGGGHKSRRVACSSGAVGVTSANGRSPAPFTRLSFFTPVANSLPKPRPRRSPLLISSIRRTPFPPSAATSLLRVNSCFRAPPTNAAVPTSGSRPIALHSPPGTMWLCSNPSR